MNILLLEDDPQAAIPTVDGLEALGHRVDHETSGAAALKRAAATAYDAVVLERLVADMDGLSVLRALRAGDNPVPVLFLTALSGVADRVEGLRAGADDYLTKPFAFAELAARLDVLFRRGPMGAVLRFASIEMNLMDRTVRRAGRPVHLQNREFRLLEQLMRHPSDVVSRAMLLRKVWNFQFDPRTNIVESHMSRLRTKLNLGFRSDAVRTVRGAGYRMNADAD
ncbi:MAG: DNA-binding response regulator [Alphaproteobacteria bacterium 65-7]|nr:MAG: DNA-binding response regulator [Alphaproteobacteria bacterium 65-7]